MKIGIPRALLYYRYDVLWKTFFKELGFETVLSPITDKTILDEGTRYSIDENCLSSKLFFGHVAALEGKCDVIFIPRIANYGKYGVFCTRFEALYDTAVNIFREKNMKFITCDVDVQKHKTEERAFISLGIKLGRTKSRSSEAYQKAKAAHIANIKKKIIYQKQLLRKDGIKILIVGHSYNLHDEYIGKPIIKNIYNLHAIPLLADVVNPKRAQQDYTNICKDVPWMVNRELVGAVWEYMDHIDGLILLTAFPCGPDSMLNEMIIRKVKGKPILNLLLDSQDGNAGIETRLESFVDIIRFRKEAHI